MGGVGGGRRRRTPAPPAPSSPPAELSPFAEPAPPAPRHLYVHVPFCRARCDYCDFFSLVLMEGGPAAARVGSDPRSPAAATCDVAGVRRATAATTLDAYVAALLAEWRLTLAAFGRVRLETVYVGGGTPSLLGPARLERLLSALEPHFTPHAEVTIEANPEDASAAFARWAAGRGVRVSLGVQSFDRRRRAALGRRAAADPAAAYHRLRAAGAGNVGLDLIFGIPGQTVADLDDDIAAVVALRPDHVSWYELDVVEGTALAERLRRSATPESAGGPPEPVPSDDERAVMYRRIVRALSGAGYSWYEVSNFALPGRRARHNVAYWRARPYLALGAGAVATLGRRRTTTTRDLEAYLAVLARGEAPPCEVEELSELDLARERLMLAARCGLRVPLADVAPVLAHEVLSALAEAGMVSLQGGTIAVTRKGRYVANEVSVRLFRV